MVRSKSFVFPFEVLGLRCLIISSLMKILSELITSLVLEENELDSYINEEVPVPEGNEAKALHMKKFVMEKRIIADSIKNHLIP